MLHQYLSEPRKTTSQFTFPISSKVNNPEMLIVSFRMRASKDTPGLFALFEGCS